MLKFMGSQRVRHDLATEQQPEMYCFNNNKVCSLVVVNQLVRGRINLECIRRESQREMGFE